MRLKIGSNMYQESINGIEILFSYETPVACRTCGIEYKTENKYSTTTTRHINKWLNNNQCETKPQEHFNMLIPK